MNRRDFMKGMAVSGLLTIIPPGLLTRFAVKSLPVSPGGWDDEEDHLRTVAIGIGELGCRTVRSIARNVLRVSCLEATLTQEGDSPGAIEELFTAVRTNDLVFLVATTVNVEERVLMQGLGDASKSAGNFPVALLLDRDLGQRTEGVIPLLARKEPGFPSITISHRSQLFDQDLFGVNANSQILSYFARHVVDTIASLATVHGMICVDFADITAILETGHGRVGVGVVNGIERSYKATSLALQRIAEQNIRIEESYGVLVCIEGDSSLTMDEYDGVSRVIHGALPEETNIITGVLVNGQCGGNLKVTIIAVDASLYVPKPLKYLERELLAKAVRVNY